MVAHQDYLAENMNKMIAHQDYLAENMGKMIEHQDYLAENLDDTIGYQKYVAVMLDKSILEKIDEITEFQKYLTFDASFSAINKAWRELVLGDRYELEDFE